MMHENLAMILRVAQGLGDLGHDVVFVGGATVPLFLTDTGAASPRSTKDVDVIVELTTRVAYYRFGEQLRLRGFQEDVQSSVLCRWKLEDLVVDVMPIASEILGFGNHWYPLTLASAQIQKLGATTIRLATPPCFLATKGEAFLERGQGDFLLSRDMEDIITVLDGRAELVDEIAAAQPELRSYLKTIFQNWANNRNFEEAIAGHLRSDVASQRRATIIKSRVGQIAGL